jgi:hypothetical protein
LQGESLDMAYMDANPAQPDGRAGAAAQQDFLRSKQIFNGDARLWTASIWKA